jgi:hypothetical protein
MMPLSDHERNESHRTYDLFDRIFAYQPCTIAGLSVLARAISLYHEELWTADCGDTQPRLVIEGGVHIQRCNTGDGCRLMRKRRCAH